MTPKQRFINAVTNQETDRPPVWMMRQAGRYLPEYRAIRAKQATKAMMQTPEIACEITLQPVDLIGVDAAILYSDILMIPDALGMGLDFVAGEGPKFAFALNSQEALEKLNTQNINQRLGYVFQAARLCAQKLPTDFPLLGFAGAPFTLACYMINGGGNSDFADVKAFAWKQPDLYAQILHLITDITIAYLLEQANAGACAVQLFDTWAGLLSAEDYGTLARPYSQRIFEALSTQGVPGIHYIKGGDYLIPQLATVSSSAIGVDWRVDLKTLRERTNNKYAIQGNFDPDLLLTTPQIIEARLTRMLASIPHPQKGYIINLGHGISEKTPVENAKYFVEKAKSFRYNSAS